MTPHEETEYAILNFFHTNGPASMNTMLEVVSMDGIAVDESELNKIEKRRCFKWSADENGRQLADISELGVSRYRWLKKKKRKESIKGIRDIVTKFFHV